MDSFQHVSFSAFGQVISAFCFPDFSFLFSACQHFSLSAFDLKAFLYRFSPGFLSLFYQRIEASPLGYRLAKGAFWSLAGSLISRGLGLLSAILVGRMLGKQEYGELGIIQNSIGMFGTLAGFGMGLTANKYVVEFKRAHFARAGRVIALASAISLISSGQQRHCAKRTTQP